MHERLTGDSKRPRVYGLEPVTMSNIIAFKAGRLQRRENTNWLDPSLTKGALQLLVAEDGLLHFQWRNRSTGTVEDVRAMFEL